MEALLLIGGTFFSLYGYQKYFVKIKNSSIRPNRWSWLIWSGSTALETLTYSGVTEDKIKSVTFFISSIAAIIVTILIWSKAKWKKPRLLEIFSVFCCFVAIFIWILFHSAWWAHAVLLTALPIAFIPTLEDVVLDYTTEDTVAWILWSIGDVFVIGLVLYRLDKNQELPYAIMECVCHGVIAGAIAWKKSIARRCRIS